MDSEARRFAAELRAPAPEVPVGQAVVLLTKGEQAKLITAIHPVTAPLVMPAARIAGQAGLPAGELSGRRFAVDVVSEEDANGFTLLDDPRL
ncbi:hypothetical protein DQ384_38505 [Sphaerisporangium album]|uniref:Uncharacterized protein n=1 Tax=Sphaerisporangium album TaxID=509200 RepID=A0A367ENP4_9ACTN|nr:hypothetical protein [Sphaerisporangium album]RCG19027.1 hypothetical protein DQ384_38505 [Sphaerisporangium album]